MDPALNGLHVAILVADGFEQVELTETKKALEGEGALTRIISEQEGKVQGMNGDRPGDSFNVDLKLEQADHKDFDVVLLPGGARSAERLRSRERVRDFLHGIQEDNKTIAAICHGVALLVSAGLVEGRTLTSAPDLQDEIRSAGGNWVDQEAVVDGDLVTSRGPADIAAFNAKVIETVAGRMQANLKGTSDEHAVGIASS